MRSLIRRLRDAIELVRVLDGFVPSTDRGASRDRRLHGKDRIRDRRSHAQPGRPGKPMNL